MFADCFVGDVVCNCRTDNTNNGTNHILERLARWWQTLFNSGQFR